MRLSRPTAPFSNFFLTVTGINLAWYSRRTKEVQYNINSVANFALNIEDN